MQTLLENFNRRETCFSVTDIFFLVWNNKVLRRKVVRKTKKLLSRSVLDVSVVTAVK